jgi:hypothetical protein
MVENYLSSVIEEDKRQRDPNLDHEARDRFREHFASSPMRSLMG